MHALVNPSAPTLVDAPPQRALAAWLDALALAPGAAESCPLGEALGRVVAHDVAARHANPPHRCAAMDGVAVRAADTRGAPLTLPAGAYATIDTGQHLAGGWDAVVPLEELERQGADVVVRHPAEPGRHVRPAGEDVRAGENILSAGRRLTAADLGLAVACGHAALDVRRRPLVALIPTGDEVRPPGGDPAPGEIPDANSVMLAAMLRDAGAEPVCMAITPDRAGELERAVRRAAAASELVLVLAGSARGGRDHTAAVLEAAGTLVVRGVALRPAHPVLLAVVGGTPVVGVPGYPVSAALTCERFALPVLAKLTGARSRPVATRTAVLAEPVLGRPDAEVVVGVVLAPGPDGDLRAWPQSRRGGALSGLARADAMLSLPAGCPRLAAGQPVVVALRP